MARLRFYASGAIPFASRDALGVTIAVGGGRTTPLPGWGVEDVSRMVS